MILHIVRRDEWDEAVGRGSYAPASLRDEGFIHCSTPAQAIDTANRFYRGQRDLIVLCIEEVRVKAAVRWEAPAGLNRGRGDGAAAPSPNLSREGCPHPRLTARPLPQQERERQVRSGVPRHPNWGEASDELFPHLYGELNVDAVVRVVELVWEEDGGFRIVEGNLTG